MTTDPFDPEMFYTGEPEEEYHEIVVAPDKTGAPSPIVTTKKPVEPPRYSTQLDVERAVLAIVLDRPEALRSVDSSRFNPELFTESRFHIAEAIKTLVDAEVVPDFVSIAIEMEGTIGIIFDKMGGRSHLRELTQYVPYGDYTFTHFFEILEDALRRRQMMDVADVIKGLAADPTSKSVESILDTQDRLVDILASTNRTTSFVSLDDAADSLIDEILERSQTPVGEIVGLSTGFRDVDYYFKGMKAGKMYILAARPAMGKSAMALNIASKIAIDDGKPVIFFSLEMSSNEVVERLLSGRAKVPFIHISDGSLSENDWANVAKAKREILQAPLYIEDSPAISMSDIRSRCQTIHAAKGSIGLVVIDYIQLMGGATKGRGNNRQEVVADISRDIKVLSKDFNCPVLALSQLNRKLEERPNKRPMASDLRESGALEQDADIIAFLYRDEVYHAASANQGVTEFIVVKNRSGESGTSRLAFLNQFVQFHSLAT